jgi:hypothetical protein
MVGALPEPLAGLPPRRLGRRRELLFRGAGIGFLERLHPLVDDLVRARPARRHLAADLLDPLEGADQLVAGRERAPPAGVALETQSFDALEVGGDPLADRGVLLGGRERELALPELRIVGKAVADLGRAEAAGGFGEELPVGELDRVARDRVAALGQSSRKRRT